MLLRAAARARSEGDAEALAAVAWAMMRYGGLRVPGGDPEFIAVVEDALVAVGPKATLVRARTLAAAVQDITLVDPGRGLALVHEAQAIAEELGDPMTLGEVLLAYRLSGDVPGNIDGGHPLADRLIELGQQTGHEPFASMGHMHRAWTCRREGALPAADDAMAIASAMLGDHLLDLLTLVMLYRSSKALLAGDLTAAEEAATEVLLLADRAFDPTIWYGPALVAIKRSRTGCLSSSRSSRPASTIPRSVRPTAPHCRWRTPSTAASTTPPASSDRSRSTTSAACAATCSG